MGILSWIVVGLIAGWLASLISKGGGSGVIGDIVLGIIGALVGGFVAGLLFGGDYISGFNFTTIVVAVIGALIFIAIMRAVTGRRV